jgi:hypothetical protein
MHDPGWFLDPRRSGHDGGTRPQDGSSRGASSRRSPLVSKRERERETGRQPRRGASSHACLRLPPRRSTDDGWEVAATWGPREEQPKQNVKIQQRRRRRTTAGVSKEGQILSHRSIGWLAREGPFGRRTVGTSTVGTTAFFLPACADEAYRYLLGSSCVTPPSLPPFGWVLSEGIDLPGDAEEGSGPGWMSLLAEKVGRKKERATKGGRGLRL